MKEKRAVLDGVATELRRIIGWPAETGLRLVACPPLTDATPCWTHDAAP
jgi:hypothetical protein